MNEDSLIFQPACIINDMVLSRSSGSGPQNVVQMSVHLSSTLLEVTIGFLQHVLSRELSLDVLNLLGSSFLFSTLLPTTLAQLGPVACKQPKACSFTVVFTC